MAERIASRGFRWMKVTLASLVRSRRTRWPVRPLSSVLADLRMALESTITVCLLPSSDSAGRPEDNTRRRPGASVLAKMLVCFCRSGRGPFVVLVRGPRAGRDRKESHVAVRDSDLRG